MAEYWVIGLEGKCTTENHLVQRKGPRQLLREEVTRTAMVADRPMNQGGFRGGLCAVWGMGSSVLSAALEPVAVSVHFQDMHVMGEPIQQRAGDKTLSELFGPFKREW